MLAAQHDGRGARERAGVGDDLHETAGQHLEPMPADQRADLDIEPGLLPHLAPERGSMILARLRPPARQLPFAAIVEQQEDTVLVEEDAFHRNGVCTHGLSQRFLAGARNDTIPIAKSVSSRA
ncbi:MAG: hypothetical protein OJF58_002737 [Enhydrobacter sp.]|nr:MAG: hypothetical protein OJF58_002737 [Enhydrobacter sp.]